MTFSLELDMQEEAGTVQRRVPVSQAVIAGWTGRDRDAMERHMAELEKLGVKRPSTTPVFYRVSANRVTTAAEIEVPGNTSSGEVEFILLRHQGELWVGVGSDHTDREVEAYGITVSKQMCDKPMSRQVWRFEDVEPHWDELLLRSFVTVDGVREPYQEGTVAGMLAPRELIARFESEGNHFTDATLMFCGTLPTHGGVRPAERFEMELEDPRDKRRLEHAYEIRTLPIAG